MTSTGVNAAKEQIFQSSKWKKVSASWRYDCEHQVSYRQPCVTLEHSSVSKFVYYTIVLSSTSWNYRETNKSFISKLLAPILGKFKGQPKCP